MMLRYKFKLYPKQEQLETLNKTLYLCRMLYNKSLEERVNAYKNKETISFFKQSSDLPDLKLNFPEYKEVYAQVLRDPLHRLDNAFNAFYRRCKDKKKGAKIKVGFPRFKTSNRYKSFTYSQFGFKILPNGHLKLSKIGTIRMFMHREIMGKIKICTLKRDDVGDWYAVFSVELPDILQIVPKTAIGVDVGLRNLVTLSNGEHIKPPKFLSKSEDKLKKLQKEVSRKKRGSQNRKRCVRKLAKAHRRVERQRDDFQHKLSKKLSLTADVILFENLSIHSMLKNRHLAKSISDASWGKLIRYTTYKAESAGKSVYLVNPNNTSQICSRCGAMVKKSLSERFHICTKCGFSTDRDLNASINILQRLPSDRGELLKTPVEAIPLLSPSGGCK